MHQFEKDFQLEIWDVIKKHKDLIDEEDMVKALEIIKFTLCFRKFISMMRDNK